MQIIHLTRPPVKNFVIKFPQREHHIFSRLESTGHTVRRCSVNPADLNNQYIAYGIGAMLTTFNLMRAKGEVLVADNIESALIAAAVKPFLKMPIVFDFIDDYSLLAHYDAFPLREIIIRHLERRLPRHFDMIIVVDEHKRRYCSSLGIRPEKIRLVPNGTDLNRFAMSLPGDSLQEADKHKSGPSILFAGKLNTYYRIDTFLKAVPLVLKRFPQARFLMIGEGSNRKSLEHLSKSLGIDRSVVFTGFVPYDEMPKIIADADVCIYPVPDSSALAIYEYMACGKPTLIPDFSTQKMGICNDIIPRDCIHIVPPSETGIAEGILSLLEDDAKREEIGKNARRLVEDAFGWDHLTVKYEAALLSVVMREKLRQ